MNINQRIKYLREEKLKKNQEEFGEKIGLKKGMISAIENEKRNVSERNIKAICKEFNINEKWLEEGIGEMKTESEMQTLERLTIEKNLSEIDKEIIEGYIQLNEKERESVQSFILKIAGKILEGEKKEEKSLILDKKNNV